MKILIITVVVLAVSAVIAWKFSRFAYETAPYTVIEKDGHFEIREYSSLTLASTNAGGGDKDDDDGAFMRLFRYIAKENEEETKIAMTTPVFMTSGEKGKMSFVVPDQVARDGAPVPKSSQVTIHSTAMGKVAAYRYSGKWHSSRRDEAQAKLEAWLEQKLLTPKGEYFSAGYDPPFTPGFLKRNEALVRLED